MSSEEENIKILPLKHPTGVEKGEKKEGEKIALWWMILNFIICGSLFFILICLVWILIHSE